MTLSPGIKEKLAKAFAKDVPKLPRLSCGCIDLPIAHNLHTDGAPISRDEINRRLDAAIKPRTKFLSLF